MKIKPFLTVDLIATGRNIKRLRQAKGLSVKELQDYFGFEDPQAIYKWQQGRSLPRADHLFALSVLLEVTMEQILVPAERRTGECEREPQEHDCDSFFVVLFRYRAQLRHLALRLRHAWNNLQTNAFNHNGQTVFNNGLRRLHAHDIIPFI